MAGLLIVASFAACAVIGRQVKKQASELEEKHGGNAKQHLHCRRPEAYAFRT